MVFTGVKVLAFDVFGTVVDWFGTIVRESEVLGERYGLTVDWRSVANRWAQKYVEARTQQGDWRPLGEILRQAGRELIDEYRIQGLTSEEGEHWVDLWSRLDP